MSVDPCSTNIGTPNCLIKAYCNVDFFFICKRNILYNVIFKLFKSGFINIEPIKTMLKSTCVTDLNQSRKKKLGVQHIFSFFKTT